MLEVIPLPAEPRVSKGDARARPVPPIAYWFASDRLYYPLRISRLERGRTRVRLLLLTPRGVTFGTTAAGEARGPRFRCYREVAPFALRPAQLQHIDAQAAALLAKGGARLSQWGCRGALSAASFDLLGSHRPSSPRRSRRGRSKGRRSSNPDVADPF